MEQWKQIPIVTRYLLTLTFGITLLANFGILNPYLLLLDWGKIIKQFEVF